MQITIEAGHAKFEYDPEAGDVLVSRPESFMKKLEAPRDMNKDEFLAYARRHYRPDSCVSWDDVEVRVF